MLLSIVVLTVVSMAMLIPILMGGDGVSVGVDGGVDGKT
jgi:hypothetical protein